jgi:HPt (histidine-containing phosphotransfer) domain-containing protein
MNASILPSKSLDKNYLLRLLQGNTEMMGVVLHEILHNLPKCLAEINSSICKNDSLGVITFASRAKSACAMLREEQLVQSFQMIEDYARKGELSSAKNLFSDEFNDTLVKLQLIKKSV